jgi:UDP-N-acetylglucosamine--N-acetylmuramyl-(pentapeptide) pyrophosphoryl-undecaprenol N-acetylglucosamine transferase
LSLAHVLKQKAPESNLVYIGNKGDTFDNGEVHYHDFDFVSFINGGKFRRYYGESVLRQIFDVKTVLLNIRDFFRVIGSTYKSIRILKRVKPDVVFSKGSFVAVPVGIAAILLRIPIVTHDSDAMPGLANKILGRWAKIHATGLPAEFYNYPKDKVRYTGIPVDEHIKKVSEADKAKFKQAIGLSSDRFVLLVTGGGLGARNINNKILEIAPELLLKYPKLHIVHIAGQKNEEVVAKSYQDLLREQPGNRVTVLSFTSDFYKYSSAADLIVTRAGGTALAEFAVAHKACILIPNPFLAGGHQIKNAVGLQNIGAVEIVKENDSAKVLLKKIVALITDSKRRKELEEKLGSTAKINASAELADILLEVAKTKK